MIGVLRELWHAQPFSPFTIHLADGRELDVQHPDFVWVLPSGGRVSVFESDDKLHHLNPRVIVSVTSSGKQFTE